MYVFRWTDEIIAFMTDASVWGDSFYRLKKALSPYLAPGDRVLDAGCGLGYLAQAVAPLCHQVVGVDIARKPVEAFARRLAHGGSGNVEARQGDVFALPPWELFDKIICCMFGGLEDALALARQYLKPKGQVILLMRNWPGQRFSLTRPPVEKRRVVPTLQALIQMGIPYRTRSLPLTMDQPFRSLTEAVRFFEIYGNQEAVPLSPKAVLSRLTPQTNPTFPYVLPVRKDMGLIVLRGQDIGSCRWICNQHSLIPACPWISAHAPEAPLQAEDRGGA